MYPVLFHIGGIAISPYGILTALGLLLGVALAIWRARQVRMSEDVVMDVAFFGTLAGFLGGRITFILTHLEEFFEDWQAMAFSRAGFSFMGGLSLALVVSLYVIRRRRERFFRVGDVVAPSLVLGHALGRLGCLTAGCCYGGVCPESWRGWGVTFGLFMDGDEAMTPPALYDHIEHGLLPSDAVESLAVWPTQIYESLANLVIFGFLWWLWRRRRFDGQIFLAYLIAYGVMRFNVEFLRGDADRGIYLGLATSQWLSILSIALGVVGWVWLSKRPMMEPPEPEESIPERSEGEAVAEEPDRSRRSRRRAR